MKLAPLGTAIVAPCYDTLQSRSLPVVLEMGEAREAESLIALELKAQGVV